MDLNAWKKEKERMRQAAMQVGADRQASGPASPGPSASGHGSGLIVPVDAAVQRRMDSSFRAALGLMFGQPREIVTVAAMAFFMGCVKAAPARMVRVVETVEAGATSES